MVAYSEGMNTISHYDDQVPNSQLNLNHLIHFIPITSEYGESHKISSDLIFLTQIPKELANWILSTVPNDD